LNVRTGFDHARGDILMILDADLTTMPEELRYFYDVITSGKAEFVHGSRFVFPMEGEAMRPLNIAGNRFFSGIFPFLLGQRITDTLCGTKALWRLHWPAIRALAGSWGAEKEDRKIGAFAKIELPPQAAAPTKGDRASPYRPSVRPSPRAGQPEPGRS
jgi:hypothetical protein